MFAGGGNLENMPTVELTEEQFTEGSIDIISLMIAAGMAGSRNEARRAVEQGGVTVKGEKVADAKATFAKDDFAGDEFIIKKGKKNFKKIVLS